MANIGWDPSLQVPSCWPRRWNLESEAFRWTIGPLFLKVAGQLPVCPCLSAEGPPGKG